MYLLSVIGYRLAVPIIIIITHINSHSQHWRVPHQHDMYVLDLTLLITTIHVLQLSAVVIPKLPPPPPHNTLLA